MAGLRGVVQPRASTIATGPSSQPTEPRQRLSAPVLDPSVASFLDAAFLSPTHADSIPLSVFVSEFTDPNYLFDNFAADLHDEPEDSLLCLYWPNIGQGGESGGGLYYHQKYHRAAVFMHMDDHGYAMPFKKHPELWHPLETVLSSWIELLQLGKVVAGPEHGPSLFGVEKIGPWEWRPYSEAQVATCLGAWDRLCDAIETRLGRTTPSTREPLLTPAVLDAASVPDNCFARDFLTRARRPVFNRIAPGLLLPSSDPAEFAALQPYTTLPRSSETLTPPVCLFSTARGEPQVDLTNSSSKPSPSWNPFSFLNPFSSSYESPYQYETVNPFHSDFRAESITRVPAGVYTESVERASYDNAEEGFRLLLPYKLAGRFGGDNPSEPGARKSDGAFVRRGHVSELFQHGYKPFGGESYRPQRLERLFDHWCRMVETRVWEVGVDGVEGAIDKFREADTAKWREYVILPSW